MSFFSGHSLSLRGAKAETQGSSLKQKSTEERCFLAFPAPFLSLGLGTSFETEFPVYIPGCPGTRLVDQVSLKLRDPCASGASTSQGLGLKSCITTTGWAFGYFLT